MPKPSKQDDPAAEAAAVRKHLEDLRVAAEPAALARSDELMAEFRDHHERDVAGYRFECRRWGDFLSLFIERNGRKLGPWAREWGRQTFATSVNVGATTSIRLAVGHGPDTEGKVGWTAYARADEGGGCVSWDGFNWPPKGYHLEVDAELPYIPRLDLFEIRERPAADPTMHCGNTMYVQSWTTLRETTAPFARPAKDDRILFEGIGATVFAPAGLGQGVLDLILSTIGDYADERDARRRERP